MIAKVKELKLEPKSDSDDRCIFIYFINILLIHISPILSDQ